MRTKITILAMAAAFAVSPLHAQQNAPAIFKTGEQLYTACTSEDAIEVAKCEWFLMASHDMNAFFQDIDLVDRTFCSPEGLTVASLRDVVVAYLRNNPDSKKYSAVSNIRIAMDAAYPCSA